MLSCDWHFASKCQMAWNSLVLAKYEWSSLLAPAWQFKCGQNTVRFRRDHFVPNAPYLGPAVCEYPLRLSWEDPRAEKKERDEVQLSQKAGTQDIYIYICKVMFFLGISRDEVYLCCNTSEASQDVAVLWRRTDFGR